MAAVVCAAEVVCEARTKLEYLSRSDSENEMAWSIRLVVEVEATCVSALTVLGVARLFAEVGMVVLRRLALVIWVLMKFGLERIWFIRLGASVERTLGNCSSV